MNAERLLKLLIRVAKFFISQAEAEVEKCNQEAKKQRRIVTNP